MSNNTRILSNGVTPKYCVNKKLLTEIGKTAELLKVVAEENRLKILCSLKKGELCVCDIWENLDLPQNLVSHHLKVLREAGLIESRKEGLNVMYSLNEKTIQSFNLLLSNLL
jgi:ArsR family transcriptional regulator